MSLKSTHVFCEPGKHYVLAEVHPVTGRSVYGNETLEQIREKHPLVEIKSWEEWQTARAAEQDVLVTWTPITEERYDEMLNVLPPVNYNGRGFQVSEPVDHHAGTGQPRFSSFILRDEVYQESSRPMTSAEFLKFQQS